MAKIAVEPAKVKTPYFSSVGRRKESVARVRLVPGLGQVVVNGKPVEDYFGCLINFKDYQKPFEVTQTVGKFGATVLVAGGGMASQLDALILGIARVLSKADTEKFRPSLKKAGLLTVDARVKERRKYGLAHAARAKKQSPKR